VRTKVYLSKLTVAEMWALQGSWKLRTLHRQIHRLAPPTCPVHLPAWHTFSPKTPQSCYTSALCVEPFLTVKSPRKNSKVWTMQPQKRHLFSHHSWSKRQSVTSFGFSWECVSDFFCVALCTCMSDHESTLCVDTGVGDKWWFPKCGILDNKDWWV
jgi:hypothetical protein